MVLRCMIIIIGGLGTLRIVRFKLCRGILSTEDIEIRTCRYFQEIKPGSAMGSPILRELEVVSRGHMNGIALRGPPHANMVSGYLPFPAL